MRTLTLTIATLAALFLASLASAQMCIEDDGEDVDMGSTADNPVEFVDPCQCYVWAEGTGAELIGHYHFFADGVSSGIPTQRAMDYCIPEKGVTVKIDVVASPAVYPGTHSPVSGSLFVRWVDRNTEQSCVAWAPAQCLIGDRVVPCPTP
jgi:hypothetical protein